MALMLYVLNKTHYDRAQLVCSKVARYSGIVNTLKLCTLLSDKLGFFSRFLRNSSCSHDSMSVIFNDIRVYVIHNYNFAVNSSGTTTMRIIREAK